MDSILKEVLKRATPTEAEHKKLESFAQQVVRKLKAAGYRADVEGSIAKDTWVSGTHDVDIFMFFEPGVPRSKLEKDGIAAGKKIIKGLGGSPVIAYAEHPYVKGAIGNFNLDIVPCYSIKKTEELQSAVDRTPFHTAYIKKNLTKKQMGETRLLKQFMKGVGVYSAKEKVRGFSGYLCELLILEYKDFMGVVRAAKNWKYGTVIDLEKFYKGREAFNLFKHSLVVIDPIDKDRNVAAAVENDNFERFSFACSEFLAKPSKKFFYPENVQVLSKGELKKKLEKHGELFVVKFKTPKLIEDILYSQLRRSLASLVRAVKEEDFEVIDSAFHSDEYSYFLLELKTAKLPGIKKLDGPPIQISQEHQKKFTDKYKKQKPWVEKGRWYVEVPREYVQAVKLLKQLLSNPRQIGIGKYISDSLKKDYKILSGSELSKEYKEEFATFLTQYLVKKNSWNW
ncbi:MAG: CCA tRNA nucleotidyltransferase [archaeon]